MPSLMSFSDPLDALPKTIRYYTHGLGMGICMSMTGSPLQKCGCGKSLTAVGLGTMLDENFSLEKVGLSPAEFLEGIDAFNKYKWGDHVVPGQVVVMDEGEIAAPSSLWFSFTNRAIFYTLSTFRNLNGLAIIATPSLKWVDSRMRTLMTFWAYCNKELGRGGKKKVEMKMYRISTDLFGEQFFFRKIRMWNSIQKRICIFKSFDVKLPDPEIVAAYEEKSRKYKAALRQDLVKEIQKFNKLSSYNTENKGETIDEMAEKLVDNEVFREKLYDTNAKRGAGFSTSLLRSVLESQGTYLKQGDAEMLRRILLKEWTRKSNADVCGI